MNVRVTNLYLSKKWFSVISSCVLVLHLLQLSGSCFCEIPLKQNMNFHICFVRYSCTWERIAPNRWHRQWEFLCFFYIYFYYMLDGFDVWLYVMQLRLVYNSSCSSRWIMHKHLYIRNFFGSMIAFMKCFITTTQPKYTCFYVWKHTGMRNYPWLKFIQHICL